ncbi:hypothetical protein F5Y16DRAFT_370577 [Xylariaceae sp. FL0255]|nr:hypothetical protein F5Y16DRAFT_370577 [Xylariaceae sp. FL0255]
MTQTRQIGSESEVVPHESPIFNLDDIDSSIGNSFGDEHAKPSHASTWQTYSPVEGSACPGSEDAIVIPAQFQNSTETQIFNDPLFASDFQRFFEPGPSIDTTLLQAPGVGPVPSGAHSLERSNLTNIMSSTSSGYQSGHDAFTPSSSSVQELTPSNSSYHQSGNVSDLEGVLSHEIPLHLDSLQNIGQADDGLSGVDSFGFDMRQTFDSANSGSEAELLPPGANLAHSVPMFASHVQNLGQNSASPPIHSTTEAFTEGDGASTQLAPAQRPELSFCVFPDSSESRGSSLQDTQQIGPPQPKNKRKQPDERQREQTKLVRMSGACLRCRMYKEKCDLKIPCGRCTEVAMNAKVFTLDCQKLDLVDVTPFRTGNSRAGLKQSVLPELNWSFDDRTLRIAHITQDFQGCSPTSLPTLALTCRKFLPGPNDVLVEPYSSSKTNEVIKVPSPPFACFDIKAAKVKSALVAYIKEISPWALKNVMLSLKDEIYQLGLREAQRFASVQKQDSTLNKALEILACVHLNFKQPILVGDETLDVPPVDNPSFDIHGKSPVPSVLDFQLDTLYILHMQKTMKDISKSLKRHIFERGPKKFDHWYEIYLTIFVLLVSLERVYITQYSYLHKTSKASDNVNIFAQADSVCNYMYDLWRASAKNIIYHFRCYRGNAPFAPSFDSTKDGRIKLDHHATEHVTKMAALLQRRAPEIEHLRDYDMDNRQAKSLVWLSELFLEPRKPVC